MANLLDAVESGNNLTDRQKARHEKTKKRDLALITLLLGTGMRVSECRHQPERFGFSELCCKSPAQRR